MVLPTSDPDLHSEAEEEALASVVWLGFQAGYTHAESQGERQCSCQFCQQSYVDPDFAARWETTLKEFGMAGINWG